MSKILRQVRSAPAVPIGSRDIDTEVQQQAEERLKRFLPMVDVLTDSRGARLIPVTELAKIERAFLDETAAASKVGREQGYEQGHARGLQEGLTKSREVMSQMDNAVQDVVGQRESLLDEAKEHILDLILKISRKVTYNAVEADPEVTAKVIRGVIDTLIDRSRLKIKVHPDHLPIIEQNINDFLQGSTAIKEIAIEADPRVACGGCFIETPTGDIDARLESQFDIIASQLRSSEGEE